MPGGYVVRDANGQALAYVYSRANEAEAMQAKVLTEDEALRIAAKIARRAGGGGMLYVVRAIINEQGETFTAESKTKAEAIANARTLRNYCKNVTITDSDGKPVDETKDE